MTPFGPEVAFLSTATEMVEAARSGAPSHDYAFHHPAILGTRLNLVIHADGEAAALEAELRAMDAIRRLDRILNWRDPASELSRLNHASSWPASPDLFAVVSAAETWRARTGGGFSGRMGRVLGLWRTSTGSEPDRTDCARIAAEAEAARVGLDASTGVISRPEAVQFDLDALAKGYIVDRALEAAMTAPNVHGAMVDIGGDIRCAGQPANGEVWTIGLPDPLSDADNAPLVGSFSLQRGALATSGYGPSGRAFAGGRLAGVIDPRTGWPVARRQSVTALASTAMDADALATAFLTLDDANAARIASTLPGASIRLTAPGRDMWLGPPPSSWRPVPVKDERPAQSAKGWPEGWVVLATFTAPPRQLKRDRAFRSPYVAIWVTDEQNRPVRTLLLVGTIKEWQQDNFIWWNLNRDSATQLLDLRSMSTRGSGIYKVLWDGNDDAGAPVAPGRYTVHVETSRERGRHTHRSMELDLTTARATSAELSQNEESGGLAVSFEKF